MRTRLWSMSFPFIGLFISAVFTLSACGGETESVPFVYRVEYLNGKFSPFFAESGYDMDAANLTQLWTLAGNQLDRRAEIIYGGIEGETVNYNGVDYHYDGVADISVSHNEEEDRTYYNIKIRDDLVFSDGHPVDIDDAIFYLYVTIDPSYDGLAAVYSYPIVGLSEYRSQYDGGFSEGSMTVTGVEGIRRVNDYELEIVTEGFSASAIYSLGNLCLAPLHYYGDEAMYKPEEGMYGFPFGDLSGIHAKDGAPMGAGAYKFVNYENNVLYLEANELYWRGEPEIKHMQYVGAPSGTEITGIIAGTHDASEVNYSPQNRDRIIQENSNGELTGDKIFTERVLHLGYGFIGISAYNVNIGGEPGSEASKNLRKAFATLLAVHRETAIRSYYQDAASVIDYPISSASWAAPMVTDEGYEIAFARDINGEPIYSPSMTGEERRAAAKQAALGFLEAAGYTVGDGIVVSPPAEARATRYGGGDYMSFECVIGADGTGRHPNFAILTEFAADMAEIGIEVKVTDIAWDDFQRGSSEGMYDIFTQAWTASADPDLYYAYHSSNTVDKENSSHANMYHIEDAELDELIFASRQSSDKAYRKSVLKQAFDIIMDWAVEVPSYQRSNFICFSQERMDTATITPDITSYYKWYYEVQNMRMMKY